MTFAIHGLAVARGIAIGRAVLIASSRVDASSSCSGTPRERIASRKASSAGVESRNITGDTYTTPAENRSNTLGTAL